MLCRLAAWGGGGALRQNGSEEEMAETQTRSPRVTHISWGRMAVEGL